MAESERFMDLRIRLLLSSVEFLRYYKAKQAPTSHPIWGNQSSIRLSIHFPLPVTHHLISASKGRLVPFSIWKKLAAAQPYSDLKILCVSSQSHNIPALNWLSGHIISPACVYIGGAPVLARTPQLFAFLHVGHTVQFSAELQNLYWPSESLFWYYAFRLCLIMLSFWYFTIIIVVIMYFVTLNLSSLLCSHHSHLLYASFVLCVILLNVLTLVSWRLLWSFLIYHCPASRITQPSVGAYPQHLFLFR